ncbi:MAG: hypothetical protein Q8N26_11630 [Myxococcales bacterium]|nr:hypothetical protein [Myxococcales bacterium]
MNVARLVPVCVLALSSACVKRVVTAPPEAFVTLGGTRATYRDWSRVSDLCAIDPKIMQQDFDSMNALLANFLGQTSAGPEGIWADEHVTLLEEAQRELPVALDLQKRGLNQASKAGCRFEGLLRTQELTDLGRKRLAEAPELLVIVKAKKALAAWKEGRPTAQQAASERSCAPPAKGQRAPAGPVLFAAFEDEKGHTEWLFCDGSKVAASPGNLPAFAPPAPDAAAKKPKKAPEPKAYLEAQSKFPSAEVSRAPRLPTKKTVKADDAPEPE